MEINPSVREFAWQTVTKDIAQLATQIQSAVNPDRVLRFRASDETVDRANEVLTLDGWRLDDFKANPVILQFHDYHAWPIGRATAVGILDDALMIDAEFDPPEIDESAEMVFQKIKHGTVKTGSVGFIPHQSVSVYSATTPEDKALLGKYPGAERVFTEQTLLEFTVCPVPCNPNAMVAGLKAFYGFRFGGSTPEVAAAGMDAEACAAVDKRLAAWLARIG